MNSSHECFLLFYFYVGLILVCSYFCIGNYKSYKSAENRTKIYLYRKKYLKQVPKISLQTVVQMCKFGTNNISNVTVQKQALHHHKE